MAKKYEINMSVSNGIVNQLIPTTAERIRTEILPDFYFMLHRDARNPKAWTISEFETGRAVVNGLPTRQAAIDKLNNVLENREEELKKIVKHFLAQDGYVNEVLKEVK